MYKMWSNRLVPLNAFGDGGKCSLALLRGVHHQDDVIINRNWGV